MKMIISGMIALVSSIVSVSLCAQVLADTMRPIRTEIVSPIHKAGFNNNGQCAERRQGGSARMVNGYQVFDASMDGYRQVDPQIAVGGNYILHGSNSGLIIYNKKGEFIQGVSQKCFNNGIDPKMFFDVHNRIFVFDLWWYYDDAKLKPVNISVSETSDPTGAWNTYPVSVLKGVDGGAIGYSQKWIGYSFPDGEERTFVLKSADAKSGKPATVYHFKGSLGHPVLGQDATDDMYFFEIAGADFVIRKVTEAKDGTPVAVEVSRRKFEILLHDWPPQSAQKGTAQRVSSGDVNPKVLVLQNGCIWFSRVVAYKQHSAVQWNQVNATTGEIKQQGLIAHDLHSYIQTTITVNANEDVLIGFQQTDSTSFISPRFAYRYGKDKTGSVREIVSIGEGKGATDGVSWGDYSGSIIDGDNLADLWTIQSITNEKGRGETVVAKFPVEKLKPKRIKRQ